MKKIIAIMMIAVFAIGMVFAATSTGAASLRITTTISPVEPTFKLATTQIYSDLATAADDSAVAAITAAALAGESSHVITTDDLLADDVEVTFSVVQITASKSVKTYTLSAAATDLVLYKYQNPAGEWILTSTTAHPATDAEKKFVVDATTVATIANGELTSAQATYDGSASAKTITYKGTDVAADTEVATFTCTWGQNENAVPGQYQGTVTLTISST